MLVRTAKFVERKQWFICGADDKQIRVYNYNTGQKIKEFQAHNDYIRSIDVHSSKPLFISCSDDRLIHCWDWSQDFQLVHTYSGHTDFVMQVVFDPKNPANFASVSLDNTAKIWRIESPVCNFTLTGHARGLNTCAYYHQSDKPYLVTGSDDW